MRWLRRALLVHKPSEDCAAKATSISRALRSRGVSVDVRWVDDAIESGSAREADVAILVGGDGTLLRFSRLGGKGLPLVLPYPCGRRLAFYEDLEGVEATELVERLVNGDFHVELMPRLEADVKGAKALALNEVLVVNENLGRTGSFSVKALAYPFETSLDVEADGVMVCSSPGSSAYNLSAGGPLVEPTSPAILVTFLSPVQLNVVPLVLHTLPHVEVRAMVPSRVYVDGELVSGLAQGEGISVKLSTSWLRVVRLGAGWRKRLERVLAGRCCRG
ncbi:MAG: NAD(+)/NADH kinase [Desulfurococcaceae archaeon]